MAASVGAAVPSSPEVRFGHHTVSFRGEVEVDAFLQLVAAIVDIIGEMGHVGKFIMSMVGCRPGMGQDSPSS